MARLAEERRQGAASRKKGTAKPKRTGGGGGGGGQHSQSLPRRPAAAWEQSPDPSEAATHWVEVPRDTAPLLTQHWMHTASPS